MPAIIFVGLVGSRETSESEPSTFRVINIPKKLRAAMSASFNTEVRPIELFCLMHFWRSLNSISTHVLSFTNFFSFFQTKAEQRKMLCWYQPARLGALYRLYKIERVWVNPEILVYRNILSESNMNKIKEMALPKVRSILFC